MAAKKKTKETKEAEETKEETKKTKKTSAKKSKKIKLTFEPIAGAAVQYKALLRERVVEKNSIREMVSYVPAIEGLPLELVVRKGEVVEVTPEQYDRLVEMGYAESKEEYKQREKFIESLRPQHPESLTWDMIVAEGANFSTLLESQNIIYNDKLIIKD